MNRRRWQGLAGLAGFLVVVASASASASTEPGVTSRVSVGPGGRQANSKPEDFQSVPAISADGRFVAFDSAASNLVPGDTNGTNDVFVRDRRAGVTSRVSVGAAGQANDSSRALAISADGRFVAFDSLASNLVPDDTNGANDVFLRDRLLDPSAPSAR